MAIRLSFFVLFIFLNTAFAQEQETLPPEYIKTIIFKSNSQQTALPVFKLGESFKLEFDALINNEEDFYYKIEHFNLDWTPSVLAKAEYLEGYDEQRIRNYRNSFNTYQIYSHYELRIPNQRTRSLKKSGNYIITIYNDDDEIVFSRRFMIYEELANVGVQIKRTRDVSNIKFKHAVDVNIHPSNIQLINPQKTVDVLLFQNNNLNTIKSLTKPTYTSGNKLIYQFDLANSFDAGNEYLYFENKDIRAANMNIQSISLNDLYNTYLYTDIDRSKTPYTFFPDVNGSFKTTMVDSNDPNIEADYAWVHFSLRKEGLTPDTSIYIVGDFNNHQTTDAYKMDFNEESNAYTKALLLKQGFYNYKYVTKNANNEAENAISGNFYQTENTYNALVYYRPLGGRYDKIIGFGSGSSTTISN